MRLLKTKPYLSNEELQQKIKSQNNAHNFLDWQIIYSVNINSGVLAENIAKILGVSIHKIYRVVEMYNKYGQDWKNDKQWGGRRDATSLLTIEQEKILMKSIESKAVNGEILTSADIREEIEKFIGKKVSDDYLWDLFSRHNWKKKAPRPKHPKSNREKQVEFKKNLKRIWMPQ